MIRYLVLIGLLLSLECCRPNKVDPPAANCYPEYKLSRGEFVKDAPVVVKLSGGLIAGEYLVAANGVAWGSCNLASEFEQDSLQIYVTGYFLTSAELEKMNVSPLPFEVISARLR
jgi:hypothetical protein